MGLKFLDMDDATAGQISDWVTKQLEAAAQEEE